jgi:hypothetical protein
MSSSTLLLIAIQQSTHFTKYLVSQLSKNLFSWGIILSAIAMIFVCLFDLIIRDMKPKQGAIKGNQYFMRTMSGFSLLSFFPTLIHENGLIEFTLRMMLNLCEALLSLY